jgi:hypothetical protein
MGIKNDIRETGDYRKFKIIVKEVEGRLNIEKDMAEALSLHAGRSSRKMFGDRKYSPNALLNASMNDMAARSRLVEIRVKCSNQIDVLHDACKAMRRSILTNFSERIGTRFKTVGDRTGFADTIIARALEIEREGQAFLKVLDTLVDDIDKTGYHLSNMTDILKLLDNSKAGKVI